MSSTRQHIFDLLGIFLGCLALNCRAAKSIRVRASTRYYGQDGPWGAITVNYGGWTGVKGLWQSFDFFPGGQYTSYVISPESCTSNSTGLCGIGGTYDATRLSHNTVDGQKIFFEPAHNDLANSGVYMTGSVFSQAMNVPGDTDQDGLTVLNTSTVVVDFQSLITPSNRNVTAVELGFLALGGPKPVQIFSDIEAWNLPGYFYNQSMIASNSYTLQMGSAALGYPPSLVFGGYDQGRLIGPPTVYNGEEVTLRDIGIGVHTGASPFPYPSKNRLLIDPHGASTIQVTPDSQGPYLSLPQQTCDAIAKELPVTRDNSGYYLWDTSDPKYHEIVSSPAYLSFTFPSSPTNQAPDDVIVKVPFKLLNLTLGPVFTGRESPVPYFPCKPYDPPNGNYYLGRAFLQAALVGRNWDRNTMWLGQAPGPGSNKAGLSENIRDLGQDDNILQPLSGQVDYFGMSWNDYWQPLADKSPSNSTGVHEPKSGLSTGAKAGIGAGIGTLALLCIVGLCVWWLKRRKAKSVSQTDPLPASEVDVKHDASPPYSAIDPERSNSEHEIQTMPQEARLQGFSSASDLQAMSELPSTEDSREAEGRRG